MPMPMSASNTDPESRDAAAPPAPLTATDRLGLIYASPGPYVSAYLQTRPLSGDASDDTAARWADLSAGLHEKGAPEAALAAVDARIGLPLPVEAAAIGVIAAADGRTIVDHALEPPRRDLAVHDNLPYAAPLLEWDQRRVPHLVVVVDTKGIDVVGFHPDGRSEMASSEGDPTELVDFIRTRVRALGARLVVVGGDPARARDLADALVPRVAPACNVVTELDDTTDGLAAATVRHVSDSVATATVGFLREFRFLAEHDAAVDGMELTVAALRRQERGVLLVHDDPEDQRRVWLGPAPHDLSVTPVDGWTTSARFVDAAIRAAIAADSRIHVIPSTGPKGPDDGTALISRSG